MTDNDITPIKSFTNSGVKQWRIKWGDDSRETTLAGIAWFACNYDDNAVVEEA